MDILPVSSQSAIFASRLNAGGASAVVQAEPAVSSPVSSAADASMAATAKEVPSLSQVSQAVRKVNDAFSQKGLNLYASFEKDKISGVDIVKIMDRKSNEVIRQLPPKEMVAFAQSLELPEGWRGQWILNMT
jgi:flagellar protein FlaG